MQTGTLTLTQFDSFKLITEFCNGHFKHTIPCDPGLSSLGGVRVEQWTRVKAIGEGGFGKVWKEKCVENGAVRAVKQMKESEVKHTEELLALTKMSLFSQYFVKFFGWFRDDENIYLAMEYLECGDLRGLIVEEILSENDVKSVGIQLLEGLKIMHEHNFCHRDLKPENILIAKWMPLTVKIADFGISKQAGINTALRTVAGTIEYIAPEVLGYISSDSSEYTNAVDIWSLGCLIYEMIAKETLFPGGRGVLPYIESRVFPGAKLIDTGSTAIEFITYMMKPYPQDRPTAGEARKHPWLQEDNQTFWSELPGQYLRSTVAAGPKLEQNQIPRDLRQEQALITAAADGNRQIVQFMLDNNADIMVKDNSGLTALHWAAYHGHLEMVGYLLEKGADATVMESRRCTPLHLAVQEGYPDVVQMLLDAGADIKTRLTNYHTPLALAAQRGHTEVLRVLLQNDAEITETASEQYTALHLAAQNGKVEAAELLIEKGAGIMEREIHGRTALHLAAYFGHLEMVQLLLEYGSEVAAIEDNGCTALHFASQQGHLEVVQILLDVGSDITAKNINNDSALAQAARTGHMEVARLLLENGADMMEKNSQEYTTLHFAAQKGHLDMARFLLERGADIMAKEASGFTALHLAANYGHLEMVQYLLESCPDTLAMGSSIALHIAAQEGYSDIVQVLLGVGTDINGRVHGDTPLAQAARRGQTEVLRLLLDHGAAIRERASQQYTALHLATQGGHLEAVRLLLERGADIEAKEEHGHTSLHLAAYFGHLSIVQLLLESGADIKARTVGENTVLHFAAQQGHAQVVHRLLVSGSDITATDCDGLTALSRAVRHGDPDLVKVLMEWGTNTTRNTDTSTSPPLTNTYGQKEIGQHMGFMEDLDAQGGLVAATDKRIGASPEGAIPWREEESTPNEEHGVGGGSKSVISKVERLVPEEDELLVGGQGGHIADEAGGPAAGEQGSVDCKKNELIVGEGEPVVEEGGPKKPVRPVNQPPVKKGRRLKGVLKKGFQCAIS